MLIFVLVSTAVVLCLDNEGFDLFLLLFVKGWWGGGGGLMGKEGEQFI